MTTEKATANIFLIRHAEKSPYGGESFSYTGGQRINALASLRIENLGHNIGYILVEKPSADGSRLRCRKTVAPLAIALDLTIDERFDRWDVKGVANAATSYRGPGDVLICWEHNLIRDIVEALSGQDGDGERDELPCYPGNRFDLIIAVEPPYEVASVILQDCPGLDNGFAL